MIMVIFGTGASYDLVPSRSPKIGIYRNPVTNIGERNVWKAHAS